LAAFASDAERWAFRLSGVICVPRHDRGGRFLRSGAVVSLPDSTPGKLLSALDDLLKINRRRNPGPWSLHDQFDNDLDSNVIAHGSQTGGKTFRLGF
jgi:hypothetical protein